MKVTIHDLRTIIGFATKVLERRNTIPILSHIRLQAEGERLTASGTNLDIQIDAWAPLAEPIGEPWSFTIPVQGLSHALDLMDGENIAIFRKGDRDGHDRILLHVEGAEIELTPMKANDWPDMDVYAKTSERRRPIDWTQDHNFPGVLQSMRAFISTEETRYYLNGIAFLWDAGLNCAVAAATDGHRLIMRPVNIPEEFARLSAILPRASVTRWADVAQNRPAKVTAWLDEAHDKQGKPTGVIEVPYIVVETNSTRMITKTIGGKYPDAFRVIPGAEVKGRATISSAELHRALLKVQQFVSPRSASIGFKCEDGRLVLFADKHDGDPSIRIDAGAVDVGGEIEWPAVGFNRNYVAAACEALGCTEADLYFSDAAGPWLMKRPGDNPAERIVLMPLRL